MDPNEIALLVSAVVKASPIAAMVIAACIGVVKYVLPALQQYNESKAKIAASAAESAEAARRSRDEAWQASLREIGERHRDATNTAVGGFKEALDRHDKAMDRYAQQHSALAADVGQVKADVASMKSDLHAVVSRFVTGEFQPADAKKG